MTESEQVAIRIAGLEGRIARLQLERDVLALNWGRRDGSMYIYIVTDEDGEVTGVGWRDPRLAPASEEPVRLPASARTKATNIVTAPAELIEAGQRATRKAAEEATA